MVLTKFVEGAREVEMDAVGKEGRVSTLSSSLPSLSSHQIFLFLAVLKHNRLEFMISAKQVSNNNGQAAQSKKISQSLTIQLMWHGYLISCVSYC